MSKKNNYSIEKLIVFLNSLVDILAKTLLVNYPKRLSMEFIRASET